jgi:hypothetical protein
LTQFRFESDGRRARSGLGDLEDRPSDRENDAARLAIVAQTSMIDGARNVDFMAVQVILSFRPQRTGPRTS